MAAALAVTLLLSAVDVNVAQGEQVGSVQCRHTPLQRPSV
jgi:hypothetical protein